MDILSLVVRGPAGGTATAGWEKFLPNKLKQLDQMLISDAHRYTCLPLFHNSKH
jgi:hypothetical protein